MKSDSPRPGCAVVTFGCRLNLVESDAMRRGAAAAGLEGAVLVNTCAVTGESVRQARQAIRRIARDKPGARIIVSGCAVETDRATFAAMPEVAALLPNALKTDPAAWRALPGATGSTTPAPAPPVLASESGTRAFLAVQNGCDHRCTFCVIPFGRGPSRSRPAERVVEAAQALVATGRREIVLTGVDLTSWGADLPGRPTLGALVRQILRAAPALARLRLSSLDCIEAGDDLLRALAEEERFAPHLHLSLQAGDDLTLKRMRRRHTRADAIAFCAAARRLRPDLVLGADFICGFPTETETMFESTLRLVDECGLTHLHVFPFSPRPGVPAARMPQTPRPVARERAERLRRLGALRLSAHLAAQIGKTVTVLVERGETGHAADFTRVATPGVAPGALVDRRIVGSAGDMLMSEPA